MFHRLAIMLYSELDPASMTEHAREHTRKVCYCMYYYAMIGY